jgi:protein-S-isoprenylcysteine O-methyltransferase Ste14
MHKLSAFNNRGLSWVIVQTVLMLACGVTGWQWGGDWRVGRHDWVIATILIVAGAIFGIAGVWVLGKNRTIFPEPRPDSVLIRKGIYRHVRHPLYSSVMFLSFGWACWQHSRAALIAAVVLTFFLILKSMNEEARLTSHFPDYAAYRRATRRFIPGLY